jgi:hypothetical protein
VGEFPELLGYSSLELNSNDRSSELVYSGIAPGLALDLMGIRSNYVLHSIDNQAIGNQVLMEALAGKRDFSLKGVVGERRLSRQVVFDEAAACPPVFSAALKEVQNASGSMEEFLRRSLPALLVRGSGICGGSKDVSGGVARLLKDAPGLQKQFRELECRKDSIIIRISHSEANALLRLLSSRIRMEKSFCSASSTQEENAFAFVDNSPVYDVIEMKLCELAEKTDPYEQYLRGPRVSAVALADTLSGVLGKELLGVSWEPRFSRPTRIDSDLPFRLRFEEDLFARHVDHPESENVRMLRAHLNLEIDGKKTSPRLIAAVLDGLGVMEGVYFSVFDLQTRRDMDVDVDFIFASTESDEALAALNKDSSVKIK